MRPDALSRTRVHRDAHRDARAGGTATTGGEGVNTGFVFLTLGAVLFGAWYIGHL